ncbi:MAG: acyltransferase [Myxococcales bacterium]|nr:acyltransferase [Myxococcales bacterium]
MLAFHAGERLPGGFLGVDLFFVLSGYLITRLLLAEHERSGRIDLGAFWARRARRLLPALLALMPAIALFARFEARPADLAALRWDGLATLGYVANWRAALSSRSYWELFSAPSPLQHTWSLAIEEQFYVLWPILVLLALRIKGRRALVALIAATACASAVAMAALYDPERTARVYYGTDTRATGILFGALFATVRQRSAGGQRRAGHLHDALGVLGLAIIGAAWLRLDGRHPLLYRGGFWVTELAAVGLIASVTESPTGVVARVLSAPPLRLLGLVSYGAYLWHWPVAVVLTPERAGVSGAALELARFAATMTISFASYHLVEKPIREGHTRVSRSPLAAALGLAGGAGLLFAGTVPRPEPLTMAGIMDQRSLALAVRGEAPARVRIAFHGDSTANSLGWTMRGIRDPGVTVLLEGDDGFNLLRRDPPAWPTRPADVRVLLLGGAFLYGFHVGSQWTKACQTPWDSLFEAQLDKWLASAGDHAASLWVATVPYPLGPYDSPPYREQVDCINRTLRSVAAARRIRVLELGEMICPRGECRREHGGVKLRPDGVHYDLEGARELAREVLARLEGGAPKG